MQETVWLCIIMIMCVCGYKNKRFKGEIPNDLFINDEYYHRGSLPEERLPKNRKNDGIFGGGSLFDKHRDSLDTFIGHQILQDPINKGYHNYGNKHYRGEETEMMNKYKRFYSSPRFGGRKGKLKSKKKGGFQTLQTFEAPDNPLNKLNRNNRKGSKNPKTGIPTRIRRPQPKAWRPTKSPSHRPTPPSESPSTSPTKRTPGPTVAPIMPSISPSFGPSTSPVNSPSTSPTLNPSLSPSILPIEIPSISPLTSTLPPTTQPTASPSVTPTDSTISPSLSPTITPQSCNFTGVYEFPDTSELHVCEKNGEYFVGVIEIDFHTSSIARGNQIITNSTHQVLRLSELTLRPDLVPQCWDLRDITLECTFTPETFQYGSERLTKLNDTSDPASCFQSSNNFTQINDPLFIQNPSTNIAHITDFNNNTGCTQFGTTTADYIEIEQFFSDDIRIACSAENTDPTVATFFTQISQNEIIGATKTSIPSNPSSITSRNDIYTIIEANTSRICPLLP